MGWGIALSIENERISQQFCISLPVVNVLIVVNCGLAQLVATLVGSTKLLYAGPG